MDRREQSANDDSLTDEEWRVMHSDPEWSKEVLDAMDTSLRKAYELHKKNVESGSRQK